MKTPGRKWSIFVVAKNAKSGEKFQFTPNTQTQTWNEIDIPFSEMQKYVRGKKVAGKVTWENVAKIGFLVADHVYEKKYDLAVEYIR